MKLDRRAMLVAVVIAFVGIVITVHDSSLPIVRNALVYAKIASRLLDGSLAISELPRTAYGKGLAFPLICIPFVRLLGPNAGVQAASCVCMLAFLVAVVVFFLHFGEAAGLRRGHVGLAVALVFANPLTVYQFWSGHADALFAACFLLTLVFLDRMLIRKSPGAILLYMLLVYATILSKNQGVVLPIAHAGYAAFKFKDARALLSKRSSILPLVVPLALVALNVYLGRLGKNPLLPMNSNADEVAGTTSSILTFLGPNCLELLLFLALGHSVMLVVVLTRRFWRRPMVPLYVVAAVYCAILFLFHNTFYNLRYFFCISPIVVLGMLPPLADGRAPLRNALVGGALVVGVLLSIDFNVPVVYGRFRRVNDSLFSSRYFDNLRMGAHLDARKSIDRVNSLPEGATVVLVGDYYDDAAFGCYEQSGLIRSDLHVRTVKLSEPRPDLSGTTFVYLVQSTRPPTFLQRAKAKWGGVWRSLGGDVYAVDSGSGAEP